MKRVFYLLAIIITLNSSIYAKNSSQDWNILNHGLGSIVEVYDNEKEYKVIEFSSNSNKDTYINGAKKGPLAWKNTKSKTLKWSFKYSQNYVIIVAISTIKGYRNLIYTANDKDFKSYIGLGSHTIKGDWVTVTRNLEEDLRRQDPINKLLSVNGFAIRGDGRIADVHMLKSIKRSLVRSLYNTIQDALLYLRNKKFLNNATIPKDVKAKAKHIYSTRDNKSVPTITLLNGDKIYLNIGENFIDPGVIAEDSNGDSLDVEYIGDVNTSQVDTYPLHYLAIDKNGNATSVTRIVVVMSKDIKNVKAKKIKKDRKAKKDRKVRYKQASDKNSTENEDREEKEDENIEKEELEDLYKREMEESDNEAIEIGKTETQEAIDEIFANAEGDTHEEKLENIAARLEELMDSEE